MTIEEVKSEIFDFCKSANPVLSSLVVQSKNWTYENGTLSIFVENNFMKTQIEANLSELAKSVCAVWGKEVAIEIFVQKTEEVQEVAEDLPENIKALRDAVRGELISVTINAPDAKKVDEKPTVESAEDEKQSFEDEILDDDDNEDDD